MFKKKKDKAELETKHKDANQGAIKGKKQVTVPSEENLLSDTNEKSHLPSETTTREYLSSMSSVRPPEVLEVDSSIKTSPVPVPREEATIKQIAANRHLNAEGDISISASSEDANVEINRLLLTIVSSFSDYFLSVAQSIFDKRPAKITFDSIRSDRKIGTTGIQLVKVAFSCELGHAEASLAVKIMASRDLVPPIVERTRYLTERLEKYRFLGVSTPRIIFHKDQLLVMEGISGESFRHSSVPLTEKLRMAGKCLAAISTSAIQEVGVERYRNLEKQILGTLPLDPKVRDLLAEKFSLFPLEQRTRRSGAISFGDFHSGNLLYEISLYKSPILVAHLIDPEFLENNPNIDRFEDVANFFVPRTINEYQLKRTLFQTSREVRTFIAGYNEVLAYDLRSMDGYYPDGDTFNYQLGLSLLLSILNLIGMPGVEKDYVRQQLQLRVALATSLLVGSSILSDKGLGAFAENSKTNSSSRALKSNIGT